MGNGAKEAGREQGGDKERGLRKREMRGWELDEDQESRVGMSREKDRDQGGVA